MTFRDRSLIIAELLRLTELASSRQVQQKAPGRDWLFSPVLATLIGVVGTAVVGTALTFLFQELAKENELERVVEEQRLESQLETVGKAYALIGEHMAAARNLIDLTGTSFNPENYQSGADYEDVRSFSKKTSAEFNDSDTRWRRQRDTSGLLLAFHFSTDGRIETLWQEVSTTIDLYNQCAGDWYETKMNLTRDVVQTACQTEEAAARDSLSELSRFMASRNTNRSN